MWFEMVNRMQKLAHGVATNRMQTDMRSKTVMLQRSEWGNVLLSIISHVCCGFNRLINHVNDACLLPFS